jgi:hypothetical protein
LVLEDAVDQLACKGARLIGQDVVDRAAGDLVLIERDHRGSPLVGPSHR